MQSSEKILFVGNIFHESGPSIVNKNLYDNLKNKVVFIDANKKLDKLLIFFKNFFYSNTIVISGLGNLNLLSSLLGFLFRKNLIYLMHGSVELEAKYRNYSLYIRLAEKIIMNCSNKIICVSDSYKKNILSKSYYHKFDSKLIVIANGYDHLSRHPEKKSRSKNVDFDVNKPGNLFPKARKVISVGGGRKEKNIKSICSAINMLPNNLIELTVVGPDGPDTDEIKSYPFVTYLGQVPQTQLYSLYRDNDLYIQFSLLESFGLAPVEAVINGCDLILSSEVGISEYISNEFVVDVSDINRLKELLFINNNEKVKEQLLSNIKTWRDCAENHYLEWCEVC